AFEEQSATVGELDIAAHGLVRAVARTVTADHEVGADRNRVLVDAFAHQGVRAAAFDHPLDGVALVVEHGDVDPRVRVDELHLRDLAWQCDGPVDVELGGERVVREDARRRHKACEREADSHHETHAYFPPAAKAHRLRMMPDSRGARLARPAAAIAIAASAPTARD